ncbi:phosphoenolpyruvate--protein phosphotransferase [Hyalangium versicolor]|uniref:phosphoenolpyruvate--protein phosphotransferase n=1 Tax=Hyalangium versicolor TaxID=2861190 RepID=UPI001CCD37A0|nr:phosphoenolpyruvate--protein phosphotransferase [Hyalangium versicolor]
MSTLNLISPLAGWATRLEEVPDPAFAQRMVGDGVAVDPTSAELRAPCDGVVVSVHASRHACTLRASTGAEILLHIGIDTVNLRGEGFMVRVSEGQRVRAGEPLIAFDMELLARKARSLVTAMVVVNGETHTVTSRVQDRAVSVGEPLLAVAGSAGATQEAVSEEKAERRIRLLIQHGMHARPAAAFSRHARLHAGTVTLSNKERTANGKSVVALMGLGARHGDTLLISVQGDQAERVAQELADLVAGGLGDPVHPIAEPTAAPTAEGASASAAPAQLFTPEQEVLLKGTIAAPGVGVGYAVRVLDESSELPVDGRGVSEEKQQLVDALARVGRELEALIAKGGAGESSRTEIFRAHLSLLDDPELTEAAYREVAEGRSAAWAWHKAVEQHARVLHELDDPLLAERVGDLRDIERRVIGQLTGKGSSRVPAQLPKDAILVADELLPSELAVIPPGQLSGICMARGGPTSHAAILAAGMGIPAVVAMGASALQVPNGAPLIVDGNRGEVHVFPPAEVREATRRAVAARQEANLASAHEECHTADGVRIEVFANLGRPGDASTAVSKGAEGCGLLRTEFLFLERVTAPSEAEQQAQYQEIADALRGRPFVIRTIDVGGDKPLAYLPLPHEENPVLGLRGVRIAQQHPEILRTQLRAILRVKQAGGCRILVPMITSVSELRMVRAMIEAERQALGVTGPVALGAMIEVPVAAVQADRLAAEADFLSIGTNDLTQYALAMDRGNPYVAAKLDSLHPGVLRLVAQTVAGARKHGRPVAVCGGIASEPLAAPLLIGLGVTELSGTPAVVPDLKAFIRTLNFPQCEDVARKALDLESGEAVRALVKSIWPAL